MCVCVCVCVYIYTGGQIILNRLGCVEKITEMESIVEDHRV